MSQNKKDQATRDREAATEYAKSLEGRKYSGEVEPRILSTSLITETSFLAGKLHERQNLSDEVRELVKAGNIILRMPIFKNLKPLREALEKLQNATKDSNEG